jgi:hypothetical protein
MATWKKVIVSGSSANLANLQVDSLSSGLVTGASGNLTTTAVNGTGNILATTGATGVSMSGSFSGSFQGNGSGLTNVTATSASFASTASYVNTLNQNVIISGALDILISPFTSNLQIAGNGFGQTYLSTAGALVLNPGSGGVGMAGINQYITLGYIQGQTDGTFLTGSFTGSFKGDGAGLTGVTATAIFPTTEKTDLAAADKFFINDGASKYVTYGNLLTDLAGTNLAVESTDSLTLATTITGITSITSTSFTGSLLGTASYALAALSSSFASTASFYGGAVTSASFATTASSIGPAVDNNVDNRVLTATGGGTINGEANLTFNGSTLQVTGDAIVSGDLTVNGTTTFINTTNLYVEDQLILIASGSNTLVDSGWVAQYNAAGSGSAFYVEAGTAGSTGTYGRFAVAYDVLGINTSIAADEYMVTAKVNQASAPAADPTWGGSTTGMGNMWTTTTGDIYIYS